MRFILLLILTPISLLISCHKKKENTATYLQQSFHMNGEYHQSSVLCSSANYRYSEENLPPDGKYCYFKFLLTGPDFNEIGSESNPQYALLVSLNLSYDPSEIDSSCFCFPKATTRKLMEVFQSGINWNDGSGLGAHKYLTLERMPYTTNYSSNYYGIQVSSRSVGDHLIIAGHVDSMVFAMPTHTDRFTDYSFEFFVSGP